MILWHYVQGATVSQTIQTISRSDMELSEKTVERYFRKIGLALFERVLEPCLMSMLPGLKNEKPVSPTKWKRFIDTFFTQMHEEILASVKEKRPPNKHKPWACSYLEGFAVATVPKLAHIEAHHPDTYREFIETLYAEVKIRGFDSGAVNSRRTGPSSVFFSKEIESFYWRISGAKRGIKHAAKGYFALAFVREVFRRKAGEDHLPANCMSNTALMALCRAVLVEFRARPI